MRRIAALLAVVTLTACTPTQLSLYWAAQAQGGEVAAAADVAAQEYLDTKAEVTAGRPCAQWYDTAIEAGWQPEQWPTTSRVMWGESRCNPNAQNSSSSAAGLMQELHMWLDDCGGTSRSDFYDPAFNLRCALHILNVSSWQAWEAY